MTVKLLSGTLLDGSLSPVTSPLVPGEVYRLKLEGVSSEKTLQVKLYKPPKESSVLLRAVQAMSMEAEEYAWKRLNICDERGNRIELLVNVSSMDEYVKPLELGSVSACAPDDKLEVYAEVEALKKLALESGCPLPVASDTTPVLAKMIHFIYANRAKWEREGKDVTATTEDGNTIFYSARNRSIHFTFGDVFVDYTNRIAKKYHLPGLSGSERFALYRYLVVNKDRLQEEAKKRRTDRDAKEIREHGRVISTWPEAVYVHPRDTRPQIPRAIQVDETGKVVLHYTRESKKDDKVLGEGGYKLVKTAIDIETGTRMASISTEDLRVIASLRLLHLFPHSISFLGISYCKGGKARFLMELCNEGDLERLLKTHSIRDTSLALSEKRAICLDTVAALRELHERGYIHRDIKPANFLRHYEAGKTRTILADHDLMCHTSDVKTKEYLAGTADYFAPEYLEAISAHSKTKIAEATTPALDVWALGCTLYEVVYGKRPIWMTTKYKPDPLARIKATKLEKPADTSSLEYLVYRMLDGNPATRITLELAEAFLRETEAFGTATPSEAAEARAGAGDRSPPFRSTDLAERVSLALPHTQPSKAFPLASLRISPEGGALHGEASPALDATRVGLAYPSLREEGKEMSPPKVVKEPMPRVLPAPAFAF